MYLLIDAGNSRLKVACHDGQDWLYRGALDDAGQLTDHLPADFQPDRIVIANVAGAVMSERIKRALSAFAAPIEWLQAGASRCGLRCDYVPPSTLGADRWAAAIGAWQHTGSDCLVICAGTATTIDVVRQPGIFAGGVILPGLSLMLDSLSVRTAALPRAQAEPPPGALLKPPTDTLTALSAGCLHAQLGAIERMASLLPMGTPILLAGGNAATLAPHLGPHAQCHPWLVMDGLLLVATNPGTKPLTDANSLPETLEPAPRRGIIPHP